MSVGKRITSLTVQSNVKNISHLFLCLFYSLLAVSCVGKMVNLIISIYLQHSSFHSFKHTWKRWKIITINLYLSSNNIMKAKKGCFGWLVKDCNRQFLCYFYWLKYVSIKDSSFVFFHYWLNFLMGFTFLFFSVITFLKLPIAQNI